MISYLFIYVGGKIKRILDKCIAVEINKKKSTINDDEYKINHDFHKNCKRFMEIKLIEKYDTDLLSYKCLIENGLDYKVQGPSRLNDELKAYINNLYKNNNFVISYSDDTSFVNNKYYEGGTNKIIITARERSPEARRECIEKYGYICQVCGIKLEDVYGPVAHNYIHVHHISFLSYSKGRHTVNPIDDLIPVCPNCHAILI